MADRTDEVNVGVGRQRVMLLVVSAHLVALSRGMHVEVKEDRASIQLIAMLVGASVATPQPEEPGMRGSLPPKDRREVLHIQKTLPHNEAELRPFDPDDVLEPLEVPPLASPWYELGRINRGLALGEQCCDLRVVDDLHDARTVRDDDDP